MKYNQGGFDALIGRLGMQHEVSRLLQAGATYEMLAQSFYDTLRPARAFSMLPVHTHYNTSADAMERFFEVMAKHYGIGTGKKFSFEMIGNGMKISTSCVRQLEGKYFSHLLFSKPHARYLDLQLMRYRLSRLKKEIYENTLEKIMLQLPDEDISSRFF